MKLKNCPRTNRKVKSVNKITEDKSGKNDKVMEVIKNIPIEIFIVILLCIIYDTKNWILIGMII